MVSKFEVILTTGAEIDPQRWDAFVEKSPQGAVFHLHGFASIIAPGWEALIVTKDGNWEAIFPFVARSFWGLRRSLQPRFSQYWGICFREEREQGYTRLSWEKEVQEALLEGLPRLREVIWRFSPAFRYPLPWHWKGFRLGVRYTFQLDLRQEEASLLAAMATTTRRHIRQGKTLECTESSHPEQLMNLLRQQAAAGHDIIGQKESDWELMPRLIAYLQKKKLGRITEMKRGGEVVASAVFVRFRGQGVYLLGTYLPGEKGQAAMAPMMWAAIMEDRAAGMEVFDFEGSMIEGVERFFRRLGAVPVPYLEVTWNDLPMIATWISALRS